MDEPIRILFRFQGGFGLGDIVQAGVTLKHLRKHRPHWIIDVKSPRGMHSALHGLCNRSLHNDEPEGRYDETHNLELIDAYRPDGRPPSKTAYFLEQTFGIAYEMGLARYEIALGEAALARAYKWLRQVAVRSPAAYNAVCIHYEGGSSPHRKNLEHWQAEAMIDAVLKAGRVPILLDWNRRSPHLNKPGVVTPPDSVWGGFGNGDAETLAALLTMCEAFVGIDSGPSKVASATETPSLVVWTNNHPLRYHDPAPNTTHLIHAGWRQGVYGGLIEFFARHFDYQQYQGEHGLVGEALEWLSDTLGCPSVDPGVFFVVPSGVLSASAALLKMRCIAGSRPINVIVSGERTDTEACATAEFLKTFDFIREVKVKPVAVFAGPERPRNTRGHLLYVSDGMRDGYHYLITDAVLQLGKRLAEWLPDVMIDEECVDLLPEAVRQGMQERGWIA